MGGAVEGFLAGCVDLVGLTVVDLVRRHQADASMVMILIIPIEEATAERLCVLDAAEPTGIMISYEDPQSLTAKADYVLSKQLGGIMIWELAADDDQDTLVTAVASALA